MKRTKKKQNENEKIDRRSKLYTKKINKDLI